MVAIALLFLYRASDTFVSDHATGDQRSYLGIAMKLDRFGFREYTLYHIDRVDIPGGIEYVYTPEKKGELLRSYMDEGTLLFDQPLFHAPPLFSYLLMLSHRAFSPEEGYKVLFPRAAERAGLRERLRVQFYSSFVPLLSGLALVVATFCTARMLFGFPAGAVAMLLVAVSPAHVLASERLWADTLLSALAALSVLFLLRYYRSANPLFFALSVVSFASALLTKNTAVLLTPALLLAALHYSGRRGEGFKRPALLMGLFFVLVFALTFPWYYAVYQAFGTPMANPGQEGISKVYFWWNFQESRPWYTYLVSLPCMVPLYIFGYYGVVNLPRLKAFSADTLLAVWFLSFFAAITLLTQHSEILGPDSRYMLPAYPPLAILAARQILAFKDWWASKVPARVAQFVFIAALLLSSAWSYSLSDPAYARFPEMYDNFMNMPW